MGSRSGAAALSLGVDEGHGEGHCPLIGCKRTYERRLALFTRYGGGKRFSCNGIGCWR